MKFKLKVVLLLSLFSIGFNSVGVCAMLVPDIYGSLGVMHSSEKNTFFGNSDTTKVSNYHLALGIRPLDIPIVGGFRIEGQYDSHFRSTDIDSVYGAVLYYDILRIIPIVNPYIGVGMMTSKLNNSTARDFGVSDSDKAFSYHIGLDFSLPIVGLNLFLEARQMKFDYAKELNTTLSDLKIKKIDTIFGIKYYFLK